jgi:LytR cell envelope-related transcriptional attenuator
MSNSTILPGGQRVERSRTPNSSGFARSVAFSAARGAALIGLAVIIGIVLLQLIDDGTSGPIGDGGGVSAGGTTNTTTPTSSDSTGTTVPTTAAAPVKPPAEVAVLVLNGSGRPGAATAQSNSLKGEGYQTLTPADASKRVGNVVYFKPGYDRECTTVANSVGGNAKTEAIPSPAPTGSENASCVVILGS